MNHARQPLNSVLGAAGAVVVCAGMLTAPAHPQTPSIAVRELPVALQALTINDIVTRVSDAITYGFAVAPVWYLGLPISIPMSIGIGFGLADLIPVVGEAFGLTWALDQVARTVVGIGLGLVVYAVGPPFMAISSLLGLTYPSVLPAAARPSSPRSAAAVAVLGGGATGNDSPLAPRRIHRSSSAQTVAAPHSVGRAKSVGTGKDAAAAASRPHATRQTH